MTETTTERTPDLAALEELYAWAASQQELELRGLPSEWDQSVWGRTDSKGCGTACCIAGRQALLDGGQFVPGRWSVTAARMPGGRVVDISEYAGNRLGLTETQAEALFSEDNSLTDLRKIIDRIAEGETFPYGYDPQED